MTPFLFDAFKAKTVQKKRKRGRPSGTGGPAGRRAKDFCALSGRRPVPPAQVQRRFFFRNSLGEQPVYFLNRVEK